MNDSLCSTIEEDYWFPVATSEDAKLAFRQRKLALEACGRCPVKDQCLEHALVYEEHGIWGGTTPRERKKLRKERGIVMEDYGIMFDIRELVS